MNATIHHWTVGLARLNCYGWVALLALPLAAIGCGNQSFSTAHAASSTAQATNNPGRAANSSAVADQASEPASASPAAEQPLRDITFDTVKFTHEKGTPFERSTLPAAVEKLNGARIRVRGYILPSYQQSGIKQFVLVRDNQQCCFGPQAALCDCMVVQMNPGQTTDFSVTPVAVEGTFTIDELKIQGNTMAVYHVAGDAVK